MIRILIPAMALALFTLAVLHHPALRGEGDPQLTEFNAHCAGDVKAHCASVARGQGRVFTCLRSKKDGISETCDDYLSGKLRKVMSSFISFRSNCGDDYSKFCKDVPRGEGRVIRCLWSHGSEISADCRRQITPFRLFEY
ncbi:MAG: hypothetical protein JW838_12455 [Spirochaetes bacterium]|nr:hypothetical protein [Spirochaetota bacterium]